MACQCSRVDEQGFLGRRTHRALKSATRCALEPMVEDKQQTPSVVAFRPASASLIRTLVEREHNQGLSGPRGLVGAKATRDSY